MVKMKQKWHNNLTYISIQLERTPFLVEQKLVHFEWLIDAVSNN